MLSWLFYSKWRTTILSQCVLGVTTSKCCVYSTVNYGILAQCVLGVTTSKRCHGLFCSKLRFLNVGSMCFGCDNKSALSCLFWGILRIDMLVQCVVDLTSSYCHVYSKVNYEIKCWLNVFWVWQQVNVVMFIAVNYKMVDNYVLDVWMAQQANVVMGIQH